MQHETSAIFQDYLLSLNRIVANAYGYAREWLLPIIAQERRQYHDAAKTDEGQVLLLLELADTDPVLPRKLAMDEAGDNLRAYLAQLRDITAMETIRTEAAWRAASQVEAGKHTRKWIANVQTAGGIDVANLVRDDDLATMLALNTQRNVQLIRSLSEDVVQRIERLSLGAVLEGTGNAATRKALTAVEGISRSRATLIARDQASKLNGQMTEFRHRQAGVDQYTWRTTIDGRERQSHHDRNGRVFSWSRPPSGGHPGSEINCRCIPQAIIIDEDDDVSEREALAERDPPEGGEFDKSIFTRVGETLEHKVHTWSPEAIANRKSELQELRAHVATMRGFGSDAEASLDDAFRRIYGFDAPKEFEVKSLLEASRTRAANLRKAIAARLAIIEELLSQAGDYQ